MSSPTEATSVQEAQTKLNTAKTSLDTHFQTMDASVRDSIKLMGAYMDWVSLKTDLIGQEKNYIMPDSAIPNKISLHTYNWLRPDKKAVVDKHYTLSGTNTDYVIHVQKTSIPNSDKEMLIHSTVLLRGSVVWVEFGYNIGCEFGGKHPAIILRNNKDSFLVAPLSSQAPNDPSINIEVPIVFGFEKRTRWVNVYRIRWISLLRIDLNNSFGSVKGYILTDICNLASTLAK